jgi:hypothetical protein
MWETYMHDTPLLFQIGVNQKGQDLHSLHLETDELHILSLSFQVTPHGLVLW